MPIDLDAIVGRVTKKPAKKPAKKSAKKPAAHQVLGLLSIKGILARGGRYNLKVGKNKIHVYVRSFHRDGHLANVDVIVGDPRDHGPAVDGQIRASKVGRGRNEGFALELKRPGVRGWKRASSWEVAPTLDQIVAQVQGKGQARAIPQDFTALVEGLSFAPNRLLHGSALATTYDSARLIGRGRIPYPVSDAAYVVVGQTEKGFDVIVFKDDEPGWTVFYSKIPDAADAVAVASNFYKDKKRQARKRDEPFRRRMAKYQVKGQKQGQLGLV